MSMLQALAPEFFAYAGALVAYETLASNAQTAHVAETETAFFAAVCEARVEARATRETLTNAQHNVVDFAAVGACGEVGAMPGSDAFALAYPRFYVKAAKAF